VSQSLSAKRGSISSKEFFMSTYVKIIFATATLFALSASSISVASAGDGLRQSCEAGNLTPHGYLDCR
jgi:hypothetical protein